MLQYDWSMAGVLKSCRIPINSHTIPIIGTSLSEPHTSGCIARQVCMSVCLWPYTVNFKLKATVRVQHRRPELRKTEIEARMVCGLYRLSTAGCSQWCKLWTEVEVAPCINSTLINTRDLAHNLSVKLTGSPCMCSCSSYPGWRNDWHMHIILICLWWRLS